MPPDQSATRVLFRAAAGPRIGFGHLKRCAVLARSLGVIPLLSLRGGSRARTAARRLGYRLVAGPAATLIARLQPALVIVDDPVARQGAPWSAAARRARVPVAAIRDMGHGVGHADLVIDGSIAPAALPRRTVRANAHRQHLAGARYALVDPALAAHRCRRPVDVVAIALGGGSHAGAAWHLARQIVRGHGSVQVRIAGGLAPQPVSAPDARVTVSAPLPDLGAVLAGCTVAVVGGGMTAYEACSLGTPTVGVAVVAAQRRAVRALAARGALVNGGTGSIAAAAVCRLLAQPARRRQLARTAAQVVDGRGTGRVTRVLKQLVARSAGR